MSTRSDWTEQAACAVDWRVADEYFFGKRSMYKLAKQKFCDHCPVLNKCLSEALELGDDERAFRAGTTYKERVAMNNARFLDSRKVDPGPTGYENLASRAEELFALLAG